MVGVVLSPVKVGESVGTYRERPSPSQRIHVYFELFYDRSSKDGEGTGVLLRPFLPEKERYLPLRGWVGGESDDRFRTLEPYRCRDDDKKDGDFFSGSSTPVIVFSETVQNVYPMELPRSEIFLSNGPERSEDGYTSLDSTAGVG